MDKLRRIVKGVEDYEFMNFVGDTDVQALIYTPFWVTYFDLFLA